MPSLEERIAEREAKQAAKDVRRAAARRDREEKASDNKEDDAGVGGADIQQKRP